MTPKYNRGVEGLVSTLFPVRLAAGRIKKSERERHAEGGKRGGKEFPEVPTRGAAVRDRLIRLNCAELRGIIFSILGTGQLCTGGKGRARARTRDMQRRTPGSRTPCARIKGGYSDGTRRRNREGPREKKERERTGRGRRKRKYKDKTKVGEERTRASGK